MITYQKKNAQKCLLLMYPSQKDNNGTDLREVVRNICPDYEVIFSHQRLDDKHMNFLYNILIFKSTLE